MPVALALGGLLALAPGPLRAAEATVVLLPFENLSGVSEARDHMAALVGAALAARGYAVVAGEPVERFLEKDRVRHLDSLTPESRTRLFAEFGASAFVSGALYGYAEGRNPIVELQLRMLREGGGLVFANAVGLTANETEGLLGLGRAGTLDDLANEAVKRLLRDAPRPGAVAERRPKGKPLRLSAPETYRAASLEKGRVFRVCLLPLENYTPAREAGKVVGDLLWRNLSSSPSFQVVEPAEFRAAMVSERVRSFRGMDPETLAKLGARLGTTLFLRGSVYAYREASPQGSRIVPEVALELSLVDVADGRILWTSQQARTGEQYAGLLQRGAIANAIALADRALGEMVAAFDATSPSQAPPAPGKPRPILLPDPTKGPATP